MMSFCKFVFLISFLLVQFDAAYAMQSLSIEWSKTENYLQGKNRNFYYEPESASVYYQYSLNEFWSAGAALWRGSAEEELDVAKFRLEEIHSGGAVNVGYLTGNWGINLSFSTEESDIDVRSPNSMSFYQEQNENFDINVSIDYQFNYDRLVFLPSLGFGRQHSDSRYELFGANLPIESFSSHEEQTNIYVFSGLNVSSSFELNYSCLVSPSLQISWTESLDSDAEQTQTSVLKFARRNYSFTKKNAGNFSSPDGSGYVGASLMFLVEDYLFRVSHTRTIELDVNYDSSSVEFGMTF